jgi:hypothetical protein
MKHHLFGVTPSTEFVVTFTPHLGEPLHLTVTSDDGGYLDFEVPDGAGAVMIAPATSAVPDPVAWPGDELRWVIYNARGERVYETRLLREAVAGYRWDGRNQAGQRVASGVYFWRCGGTNGKVWIVR